MKAGVLGLAPDDPLLKALHEMPSIWWVGQLLSFVFKPQPDIIKEIEKIEQLISFLHPIVGYVLSW